MQQASEVNNALKNLISKFISIDKERKEYKKLHFIFFFIFKNVYLRQAISPEDRKTY